jgi:hypothetical protein
VLLLFVTISVAAFLLVNERYVYLILVIPIITYQIIEFNRFQRKTHEELSQFVEAVHYRDFSRYFDVKHAPAHLFNGVPKQMQDLLSVCRG